MVQDTTKTRHSLKTSPFRSGDEINPHRRKKAMIIPAANVDETDSEYILTIATPGFKKENFQVIIDQNIITIAATKETSDNNCIHDRCEYDYHRWKRDFLLPDDADPLLSRARYKEGELIIRIPKGNAGKLSGLINIYVY